MGLSHDAVLVLAFGGPASPEDVRPFLARVLRGYPVPPERVEEVARHYEAVGGRSPLNEITLSQASALEAGIKLRGLSLPVYVGLRHSRPFIRETLDQMTGDGVRRAIGFILSPHQTEASWERYQKNVAEAREELGGAVPEIKYSPGWHDHPLFVQTWTEQIEAEMEKIAPANRERTVLLFTAHSIPAAMAARSPYVEQIEQSCSLIAARLGHHRWSLAYQSRSGSPKESWLEPDIGEALTSIAAQGAAEIIAAAIGFVSDHVEVLYDLDIEARKKAESLGLLFRRASCPNDRPTFIRMMAEVVEAMHSAPGRRS